MATHPVGLTHEYRFRLVSPIPRTVYDANLEGTLKDHLGRSGNLIVELMSDELEDAVDE